MMDATLVKCKEKDTETSNVQEKYIDTIEPDINMDKDSLVFHGVALDKLEEETKQNDAEIKTNFIEHKIRQVMKDEWGIDCNASFKHVFRYAN